MVKSNDCLGAAERGICDKENWQDFPNSETDIFLLKWAGEVRRRDRSEGIGVGSREGAGGLYKAASWWFESFIKRWLGRKISVCSVFFSSSSFFLYKKDANHRWKRMYTRRSVRAPANNGIT